MAGRGLKVAAWGAACAAALVAAGVGATAVTSAFKPPVPPVIAVVDLEEVIKGLDERADLDAKFNARRTELQSDLDRRKKDIETKQTQMEAMPDTPQRKALGETIIKEALQLRFEKQYAEEYLDQLYGEYLRGIYAKVTESAKELAVKNGYTMVLSSDERVPVPRAGEKEVVRAISMKRMLYVDPSHDVTKELITLMNNAFAAAGGKPAAAAPGPPAPPAPAAPTPPGTNK